MSVCAMYMREFRNAGAGVTLRNVVVALGRVVVPEIQQNNVQKLGKSKKN